ncbi:Cytochrome P450 monooxygenase CLM2 [Cladobotryum mycophilum]|uniref:Cytochrome P450 monooxygenase CLM2 n=1 Tax=Cladobotryum mycophilum TaxID=491253 RepID=A0ABR0SRG5_9HYPO
MSNLLLTQAAIALLGYVVYRLFEFFHPTFSNRPILPPGPKPLPVIGNTFDLPGHNTLEYEHWNQHRKYGPISSVTVLNQTIVIIHDRHVASEILEKTSVKTSGRPLSDFVAFCGYSSFTPILQNDYKLRDHRKFMHQLFGTKHTAARFLEVQELEARRLLLRVLATPDRVRDHFVTEAGAVILKIVYGYTVEPHQPDLLVTIIEQMMENFDSALLPFTRAFDFWPALFKRLPEGLPGTGFRETARRYNKWIRATVNMPYEFVQQQVYHGVNTPSYVSTLLESIDAEKSDDVSAEEAEEIRKHSAATLYLGGSDTTVSTLYNWFLAMVLHPEVQRKAQEEIDRVTDSTARLRLPNHEDLPHMPYLDALATEVYRWGPVTAMGFPHRVDEDITYNDYVIPKDSVIFPHTWWFTHDPETYPNPEIFEPERFLSRNEPDPKNLIFGYGRRTCSGRNLAESTVLLTIVHILSMYNIGKAVDKDGNEITPKQEYKRGFVSHLKEFPYTITPRSEKHRQVIQDIEREHPWEESNKAQLKWRDLTEADVRSHVHSA